MNADDSPVALASGPLDDASWERPLDVPTVARTRGLLRRLARSPSFVVGLVLIATLVVAALAAPWLSPIDPIEIHPAIRNKPPGFTETGAEAPGARPSAARERTLVHWMGTDTLGRDVYSRVIHGARVSLLLGASVASISVVLGLALGMLAGSARWLDAILMRVMDGLMAIPPILLAIAVMSLSAAGLAAVIVAIVIPEVPRVTRLVRSVVLASRGQPYVEAALASGAPRWHRMLVHVLPATLAPLAVQATYVAGSAILIEATLSFLGIGIPATTPTWGNVMAEGRALFRVYPHAILFPGVFLATTVLAINMLGDALRDAIDPRLARAQ